ncbi:hypothetical protein [Marinobacter confluentis]|uniref:Uncharacterized protein n=1 Tax=Marinobacter confluentis TaxID=1697557 RepID=A0A4Z1BE05_9GAMM|nr:hypothetical protein [Marinobacter confluentis]TGN40564.1 hypothetical protein E5Q11_09920 [Marinobacter confluentis]
MEKLLGFANTALLLATLALIVTVLVSYPFAAQFNMSIQIAAHIGTLLFATAIKLSYILRLVSLKSLGRPVH